MPINNYYIEHPSSHSPYTSEYISADSPTYYPVSTAGAGSTAQEYSAEYSRYLNSYYINASAAENIVNFQRYYSSSYANYGSFLKEEPYVLSVSQFISELNLKMHSYYIEKVYVKVPIKVNIKNNIYFAGFFDKVEYTIPNGLEELMNIFYYENLCNNKEIRKYFNKEKREFFTLIKENLNELDFKKLRESVYLSPKPKQLELI